MKDKMDKILWVDNSGKTERERVEVAKALAQWLGIPSHTIPNIYANRYRVAETSLMGCRTLLWLVQVGVAEAYVKAVVLTPTEHCEVNSFYLYSFSQAAVSQEVLNQALESGLELAQLKQIQEQEVAKAFAEWWREKVELLESA